MMARPSGFYTGPRAEDLDRIPEALKRLTQWVLFQLLEVPDANGELKLTKIPINPHTFRHGSTTAPATWGMYAQCVERLLHTLHQWGRTPPATYTGKPATYRGAGIGFVFTPEDPFMLVDLDKSLDVATGRIAAWAQDIVTTLQSYTQRLVSGTGLHVLLQATIPQDGPKQHGDVQMWDHGRFCAMTGWHLPETPYTIEERQAQLEAVHAARILLPKAKAQAESQQRTRQTTSRQRDVPPPTDAQGNVEAALGYIPAEDRTTWYTMGMALHSSGEPWARAVWNTWSQRSEKFDTQDQERVWKSFKADGGVTLGTLIHEAKLYGYVPPPRTVHSICHMEMTRREASESPGQDVNGQATQSSPHTPQYQARASIQRVPAPPQNPYRPATSDNSMPTHILAHQSGALRGFRLRC